jgi:Dolichyl-phosphate-mannose-protein mannosyltransferase
VTELPSGGGVLPPRQPFAMSLVLLQAVLKLGLHVTVNLRTPYGFHRDELLYLGMGRHFQLWGMDFPPAIAVLAEVSRALLGDSITAIRFLPAVFGCLLLVLAAVIARELGGGRIAQGLAAFCVLTSPLFLRSANLMQPVVMNQLVWTGGLYALLRLCRGYGPGNWLLLGLVLGLGLLTDFNVALIGLAIVLGVLRSPLRFALLTPWPWIGLGAAIIVGSPSIVGQLRLGFPALELIARENQLEGMTAAGFLVGQLLWGPAVLLGAGGLYGLLATRSFRPFRALGWSCLAALVMLLLLQKAPYYAGSLYPSLFAAGAVLFEQKAKGLLGEALMVATIAILFAFCVITLPLGVPVLPPPAMAGYAQAVGVTAAEKPDTVEIGGLPQEYADMLGWEEQVATVARVYHSLPPNQRGEAVVVAGNYGEAGALDYYGPRYGLPPVVSPAGSYWFFGPGQRTGEVVVAIGIGAGDLRRYFDSVETAATVTHPWVPDEERRLTVSVATAPRTTLQRLWPSLAERN